MTITMVILEKFEHKYCIGWLFCTLRKKNNGYIEIMKRIMNELWCGFIKKCKQIL